MTEGRTEGGSDQERERSREIERDREIERSRERERERPLKVQRVGLLENAAHSLEHKFHQIGLSLSFLQSRQACLRQVCESLMFLPKKCSLELFYVYTQIGCSASIILPCF